MPVKLKELKTDANMADLLAHRLGVTARNQYWTQLYQKPLLDKIATAAVLADLQPIIGFREKMFYNNWAYGLAGEILEYIKAETTGQLLKREIFDRLGMANTTLNIPASPNYVSSYITLTNGIPYRIPAPGLNDDGIVGTAGACKSSLNDLMKYYKAIMEATEHQERSQSTMTPNSPFSQLNNIWDSHIPITEGSDYGFGWVLTHLPGRCGLVSVNSYPVHLGVDGMPEVGRGIEGKQRLVYHNGAMIGASSSVYILPDMQTAVVVLSNTFGLADTPDWVGQLLLEAILDVQEKHKVDFVAYARKTRAAALAPHPATQRKLIAEQVHGTTSKPLSAYVGRYVNSRGYFHVDITVNQAAQGKSILRMTIQGIPEVYYLLYHYNYDTFAFDCDRDEESKRCFMPQAQIGFHRIKFEVNEEGIVESLN